MSVEEAIEKNMFTGNVNKTFLDKLFGKEDIETLKKLSKKSPWKREDVNEVMYMLAGVESKLHNYSGWDRYVILKFYVWIRENVKALELLFDYKERLDGDGEVNERKVLSSDNTSLLLEEIPETHIKLSSVSKKLFENIRERMEHNIKFLVDLYLNIGRTSMSIGATAFLEALNNKYEISYGTHQTPEKKTPNLGQRRG